MDTIEKLRLTPKHFDKYVEKANEISEKLSELSSDIWDLKDNEVSAVFRMRDDLEKAYAAIEDAHSSVPDMSDFSSFLDSDCGNTDVIRLRLVVLRTDGTYAHALVDYAPDLNVRAYDVIQASGLFRDKNGAFVPKGEARRLCALSGLEAYYAEEDAEEAAEKARELAEKEEAANAEQD